MMMVMKYVIESRISTEIFSIQFHLNGLMLKLQDIMIISSMNQVLQLIQSKIVHQQGKLYLDLF